MSSLRGEVDCNIRLGRTAIAVLLLQRMLAIDSTDENAQSLLSGLLENMGAKGAAYQISAAATETNTSWWSLWFSELRRGAWLAMEVGNDSNINRATDTKVVQSPLLNYRSLSLNPILVQRPSSFISASGGIEVSHPLTPYLNVGVRGVGSARYNAAEYVYLPNSYHLAALLSSNIGNLRLEAEAATSQHLIARLRVVDRQSFGARASVATYGDFVASLSMDSSSNLYPQFSLVKTREQSFGAKVLHPGTGMIMGTYQGTEKSTGTIKDLDRIFRGYSLGWRSRLWQELRLGFEFESGESRYQEFSRLFDANRVDSFQSFSISGEYRLGSDWYLTPKWIAERNNSTIALSRYRRNQYLIEIRKEFQ